MKKGTIQLYDFQLFLWVKNLKIVALSFGEQAPIGVTKFSLMDKSECAFWQKKIDDNDFEINPPGTPFQLSVWAELMKIPYGETRSYAQIASNIGKPTSVRAVANAIGKNKIAILVPCHRVLRTNGDLGGFYWGLEVKRKLLQFES